MAVFGRIIKESKDFSSELSQTSKAVKELRIEIFSVFRFLAAVKEIPEKIKEELKILKSVTKKLGTLINKIPLPGYFKFISKGIGSMLKAVSQLSAFLSTNLKFIERILKRLPDVIKIEAPFKVLEGLFNRADRLVVKTMALMAILEHQEKDLEKDDKGKIIIEVFEKHEGKIAKLAQRVQEKRRAVEETTKTLREKKEKLEKELSIFENILPKFKRVMKRLDPFRNDLEEFFDKLRPIAKDLEEFIEKYATKVGEKVDDLVTALDESLSDIFSYFGIEDKYKEFKKSAKKFYKEAAEAFDAIDDLIADLLKEIKEIKSIIDNLERIQKELMDSISEINRAIDEQVNELQKIIDESVSQFEKMIQDSQIAELEKFKTERKYRTALNDFRMEVVNLKRYFELVKVRLKRIFEESDQKKKKKLKGLKKQSSSRVGKFIDDRYALIQSNHNEDGPIFGVYDELLANIGNTALIAFNKPTEVMIDFINGEEEYELMDLALAHVLESLESGLNEFDEQLALYDRENHIETIDDYGDYFNEFKRVLNWVPEKEKFKIGKYASSGLELLNEEPYLKVSNYKFSNAAPKPYKFKNVKTGAIPSTGLKKLGTKLVCDFKKVYKEERKLFELIK